MVEELAAPAGPFVKDLAFRDPATGVISLWPHSGQWQAWQSQKRFIAVIAGTQSG